MAGPQAERAIIDSLRAGRALLKFISPNDTGLTGSHQCGFYLPIAAWEMFTPQPPKDDLNHKHPVSILWPDGRVTGSVVTWYGKATRHEYRLTRFGRDFPYLTEDSVGNLLVLIPRSVSDFCAYVLDLEEDIEEVQAALDAQVMESWAVYEFGQQNVESENDCIDRQFRHFAGEVAEFPSGKIFSEVTREALFKCVEDFPNRPADDQLLKSVEAEFQLFRLVERRLCEPDICRIFKSVDDFLQTAATIMNRRKSRAGRSFENHVEFLLRDARIPFDVRANVDGKPDVLIPSCKAYEDKSYPTERLFVVGLKTTCKDRWRQVTREGIRVPRKYLLTLQPGISKNQLAEMEAANVRLVVPRALHKEYPPAAPMKLLCLDDFIAEVKTTLLS